MPMVSVRLFRRAAQYVCNDVRRSPRLMMWLGVLVLPTLNPGKVIGQTEPLAELSRLPDGVSFCDDGDDSGIAELLLAHPELETYHIAETDSIEVYPVLLSRPLRIAEIPWDDHWVASVTVLAVLDSTGTIVFAEAESTNMALVAWGSSGPHRVSQAEAETYMHRFEDSAIHFIEAVSYRPATIGDHAVATWICQPMDFGYEDAGVRPANRN